MKLILEVFASLAFLNYIFAQNGYQFDYLDHGANWGLSFSHCNYSIASQKQQSPINIVPTKAKPSQNLIYFFPRYVSTVMLASYLNVTVYVQPSRSGLQISTPQYVYASTLQGQDTLYTLQYLKIHTPSEHQINAQTYDLELQISHQWNSQIQMTQYSLLVGLLFQINDNAPSSKLLQALIDGYSSKDKTNTTLVQLDLTEYLTMLSNEKSYYQYVGSSTTPTVTGNFSTSKLNCQTANWLVFDTPFSAPSIQVNFFQNMFNKATNPTFRGEFGNNRLIIINNTNQLYYKPAPTALQKEL